HRPSMVVGAAATGRIIHFQIFYHLCEFLSGRRTFGLFPRLGTARLDTIPVDGVARAIGWAGGRPEWAGRVLHPCAGPEQATRLKRLCLSARSIASSEVPGIEFEGVGDIGHFRQGALERGPVGASGPRRQILLGRQRGQFFSHGGADELVDGNPLFARPFPDMGVEGIR
ncbi:hypothetical protein RZS08_07585, partial [Arthrospira platensis SPKY1]|nr:hypothetical protein [Arthrospira platensis SPKY1]